MPLHPIARQHVKCSQLCTIANRKPRHRAW
jgi:hypothetical protein